MMFSIIDDFEIRTILIGIFNERYDKQVGVKFSEYYVRTTITIEEHRKYINININFIAAIDKILKF